MDEAVPSLWRRHLLEAEPVPYFGPRIVNCLIAVLVAFPLVAGPTLCRASNGGCGDGRAPTSECPSREKDQGGTNDQHHPEDGGGQDGCPEVYLMSAVRDLALRPAESRLPPPLRSVYLSPAYDVPAPVPIV